MVEAITAGKKTQTRRIVNPRRMSCPYGEPGDVLWVKERYRIDNERGATHCVLYDENGLTPLFMPRWASRLTLKIIATRRERLQAITETDATAEGFEYVRYSAPSDIRSSVDFFRYYWDSIHGNSDRWDENPDVWVIEFEPSKVLSGIDS